MSASTSHQIGAHGPNTNGPEIISQSSSTGSFGQDFEAPQREALSAAVRENLQKFPVEMQAMQSTFWTLWVVLHSL